MDAIDKIISFLTIDELKTAIESDMHSKDVLAQRYCIRFIMLNNFSDYKEIYKWLCSDKGVTTYDIESLVQGDDLGISSEMLISVIAQFKQSTLITPFSEVVRFFPEEKFRGFFNQIILTEDIQNPSKRIYIPIIGLHNRFTDFLKNFGRVCESAPIWQYYSSTDQVLVYITDFDLNNIPQGKEVKKISTMKEWLKFWKTIAPIDKIICSARPIRNGHKHSKPDSIFTFHKIANAYEYLSGFLNIEIPILYKNEEDEYWQSLVKAIVLRRGETFNFGQFVADCMGVLAIDSNNVIEKWSSSESTNFDRWLLRHYVLQPEVEIEAPYLKACIEGCKKFSTPQSLVEHIALRIFHSIGMGKSNQMADERRCYMQRHHLLFRSLVSAEVQNEIREELVAMVQKDNAFCNVKNLCVGIFDFEKILFVGWYTIRNGSEFGKKDLETLYPELGWYLDAFIDCNVNGNCSIKNYFDEYRKGKLIDKNTEEINNMMGILNASEVTFYQWFYSLEDEHEILSERINNPETCPDKIYWIDGLGAEFMPLIINLLSHSSFSIIEAKLARTGLPSNTHLNAFKYDGETSIKISDLDILAHSVHYKKYETIVQEIKVVCDIIKRIVNEGSMKEHTIAIVSDHGLSALSRLTESIKLSNEAKHEGRYVHLDNKSHASDSTSIVVRNDKDKEFYRVALTHASLGTKPVREVHGGATPEEVVVPFLLITNKKSAKPIDYTITLLTEKLPVSEPIVKVDIMPKPNSAKILVGDKEIELEKKFKWEASLNFLAEGEHEIVIVPEKGIAVKKRISIFGLGGQKVNIFDDF